MDEQLRQLIENLIRESNEIDERAGNSMRDVLKRQADAIDSQDVLEDDNEESEDDDGEQS